METKTESRISYVLVGVRVGAIGGMIAALLARKETRQNLLERGTKSFDYLKERGQRLRVSTKEAVKKGRHLIGCQCQGSVETIVEGEEQPYEEERRERMGG